MEAIQRTDKENDIVDEVKITPQMLKFERIVNLGNYENVKLGGDFKIPEGMNTEQALSAVANFVAKQIELYVEKENDSTAHKIERIKNELQNYSGRLKDIEQKAELKKERCKAQLLEVIKMLRDVKNYVESLAQYASGLFSLMDNILKEASFTLEDLGFNSEYYFSKKYVVKVVNEESPKVEADRDSDSSGDDDPDDDDDDYEDDDDSDEYDR